jgi:hypothetical protein
MNSLNPNVELAEVVTCSLVHDCSPPFVCPAAHIIIICFCFTSRSPQVLTGAVQADVGMRRRALRLGEAEHVCGHGYPM